MQFMKSITVLAVYILTASAVLSLQNFLVREKMHLFYKIFERTMLKIKMSLPIQI